MGNKFLTLLELWDFDHFGKGENKRYTTIILVVTEKKEDGTYNVVSWDGLPFADRKQTIDKIKTILSNNPDIKDCVIDPGLKHKVAVKRIECLLNVQPYNTEKHSAIFEYLVDYFDQ